MYQSVCTHETLQLFFLNFKLIPTLLVAQASQSQQNSVLSSSIFFFFCPYMYSCTCTNSVCMSCIYASDLHHRPWVVTVWLLCSRRWNGTVYQQSGAGELVSFFIHKSIKTLIFVHSGASGTENKWSTLALPLSGSLYPFPISLSHTHAHAHTL